jgi:hypothetical protein
MPLLSPDKIERIKKKCFSMKIGKARKLKWSGFHAGLCRGRRHSWGSGRLALHAGRAAQSGGGPPIQRGSIRPTPSKQLDHAYRWWRDLAKLSSLFSRNKMDVTECLPYEIDVGRGMKEARTEKVLFTEQTPFSSQLGILNFFTLSFIVLMFSSNLF